MIKIEYTGDKQLDKMFAALPEGMQKRGLRKATREVAKITRDVALDMVPERSGALARSLKVRARKRTRKYPHTVATSVITGEELFSGEAYYGGFLEFGTVERKTKAGKSVGRIEPGKFSFLRPALLAYQAYKLTIFKSVMSQWMRTLKPKR